MTHQIRLGVCFASLVVALAACGPAQDPGIDEHGHDDETERGPNGGRLLVDGDFVVELAIFEGGVQPEFRAWVTKGPAPVPPREVELDITLDRLGDVDEQIGFAAQADFLRSAMAVREPHSFVVTVVARHRGGTYRWSYDSFEGRAHIEPDMAAAMDLGIEVAGPAEIREVIDIYGRVVPDQERVRTVSARFAGVVRSVEVAVGDRVQRGQALAQVESDDSLRTYAVVSPISGIVIERHANPGEQTAERTLFTIIDTSSVWAELAVFPSDRGRVAVGTPAVVAAADGSISRKGEVSFINSIAEPDQSVLTRVVLDNSDGAFVPGSFVTGELLIARHSVPLAVKRTALQAFRDFTVVFAQIGNDYEVRMLDLGRQDDLWVEVLGGLQPGTNYVAVNSYLVKADIEKAGAAHDH